MRNSIASIRNETDSLAETLDRATDKLNASQVHLEGVENRSGLLTKLVNWALVILAVIGAFVIVILAIAVRAAKR